MNLANCPGITKEQAHTAGLYALWIAGREYLREHDPSKMGSWDLACGAVAYGLPHDDPRVSELRIASPEAFDFASNVGVAIYAVPGWFPAQEPGTCHVHWLRFACTMRGYAGLDSASLAQAISQRVEADPDDCSRSAVYQDEAYVGFGSTPPSRAGGSRWPLYLALGLPLAFVVLISSLAGSGRRQGR